MRLSPHSGYTLMVGIVWTVSLVAICPSTAGPLPLARRLGQGLADFVSGGATLWLRGAVRLLRGTKIRDLIAVNPGHGRRYVPRVFVKPRVPRGSRVSRGPVLFDARSS